MTAPEQPGRAGAATAVPPAVPAPPPAGGGGRPRPGPAGLAGWGRWAWRQLTSMRTALVLLFALALASVPGSVLPQQGIDPQAVQRYYAAHPGIAPWLARLSLFDVFAAPWFAAVYLLLFASLAGCVIPRTFRQAGSARQQPPRAPRNLSRLPLAASHYSPLPPRDALAAAATTLARKRFRVRAGDGWVAAEKGYLREAGNLLFHLALLGLLVAVGMGGLLGYKANRLLVQGQPFANTVTALDQFRPGRLVSASDLQPFTLTMDSFSARYINSGALRGQPSSFDAHLRYSPRPGSPSRRYDLRVNHPLNVEGVKVFLIGHGYAPVFRVTDGTGAVVFDDAVPFIPAEEAGLTSEGVIKVPDARPEQLGFAGVFLPTAVDAGGRLMSAFPAPLAPRVSLVSFAGDLRMNNGPSQSVYQLDTAGLHKLAVSPRPLAPGQSITLPGGRGTLTFTGYRQWISLAITYDPGQVPALVCGLAALAGLLLSFLVRRRRVFVRAHAAGAEDAGAEDAGVGDAGWGDASGGRTVVEVGGLPRTEAVDGFEAEFTELCAALAAATGGPGPGTAGGATPAGATPAGTAVASSDEHQPFLTTTERE